MSAKKSALKSAHKKSALKSAVMCGNAHAQLTKVSCGEIQLHTPDGKKPSYPGLRKFSFSCEARWIMDHRLQTKPVFT